MIKQSKLGFTLIELIVVIGVIAVLATLTLTILNPVVQFEKANDAKRKEDLSQIQKSLEQYYQDNGVYPTGTQTHELTNPQLSPIPWGNAWTPYMNILPADSDPTRSYEYISTGQTYWIYASLQRGGQDSQACKANSSSCSSSPQSNACTCGGVPVNVTCGGTNVCNYGVSSPNTAP